MTDHAPFLAAILADPDDMGPRLCYADALDEWGDPRGEFIRVQCELARLGDPPRRYDNCHSFSFLKGEGEVTVYGGPPAVGDRIDLVLPDDEVKDSRYRGAGKYGRRHTGWRKEWHGLRVTAARPQRLHDGSWAAWVVFVMDGESGPWPGEALRRRERELLAANAPQWFSFAGLAACAAWDHPPLIRWCQEGTEVEVMTGDPCRGFPESVTLTAAQFLGGPCGRCGGERFIYESDEEATAYDEQIGRQVMIPRIKPYVCPDCRDPETGEGTGRTPGLAAKLARLTPLTGVTLSDREPDWAHGEFYYWRKLSAFPRRTTLEILPDELYNLLPNSDRWEQLYWHSAQDAVRALSRAAVALARKRARPIAA
jgi:uncharacterized protein (TIGR02996 family)